MAREESSRQEEQVNLIIERIREITGDKLNTVDIAAMIRQVIQMRENGDSDEAVRNYISSRTDIEKNNEKAGSILSEIIEKPLQNNYQPFKNSILDQLKKDLGKE